MLADKTLLASALFVTFVSGGTVGYVANGTQQPAAVRPYAIETVFAEQLVTLDKDGYSAAEIDEAKGYYRDYFASYQQWWNNFVDTHADALDRIDDRLEERMNELGERHAGGDGR